MKLNEIPENQGGRGPLPLMENYQQAEAVARKEHDYFYLCAFMMQSWIQRLVAEAAIRLAPNNQHPTGSLARRWPFRHCPRYRQAKMDSPLVSPPPLPFVHLFTANNPSGHESPTDEALPKRDGCEMDARFGEMQARFPEMDARFSEMRISANLGKSRQISGNLGKSHCGEFSAAPNDSCLLKISHLNQITILTYA